MSKQNNRIFEFDNFRADAQHKCLWHNAELVSLTPRAFDTLLVLLENNGQVVDKNTLLDKVWGDTFVEEAALKQNISTLRKKFDSLNLGKEFIETIPRRGYRFIGSVREVFDEEELYVVETRTRTHIVANQEIHLSGESISATRHKSRKLILTGVLAFVVILSASFFAFLLFFQTQPMSENRFKQFEIKQITANGNIHKVAISPDGKYLALVEKKNDLHRVLLRQVDNSNNIEIVPPTNDDVIGVTFSPDNTALYYVAYPFSKNADTPRYGVLNKIPVLGGTNSEVLRDIDSPVSISPDGRKFVFVRDDFKKLQSTIVIYDSATSENHEKVLASRDIYERFNKDSIAWSPDGKKIATVAYYARNVSQPFSVLVLDVETSREETLSNEPWSWIGQLNWLNDGSGIILTGFAESSDLTDEVWVISYPKGEVRRITNGINGFYGTGINSDSTILATVKSDQMSEFWVGTKNNFKEATLIQKNSSKGSPAQFGLAYTYDNKILYSTAQSGNADIWMMNRDGSEQKQITKDDRADLSPIVSNENRYIVFISNRSGTKNLWRMNIDGREQTQLTNFESVFSPSITPDGEWVYFSAATGKVNKPTLWKIHINGGQPQSVSNLMVVSPQVSPDGKFVACFYPSGGFQTKQNARLKLTVLNIADASIFKQFEIPYNDSQIAWTSDSKSISYIEEVGGTSTILLHSIYEGISQKVYNTVGGRILNHRWSNNGENLILEKGEVINDIVLIKNK